MIAARDALSAAELTALRAAIDAHLTRLLAPGVNSTVAFCWPYHHEYDARHVAQRLRAGGAKTAVPVVVAARQPLIFRLWQPGDALAKGVYDIPYPAAGDAIVPDVALVPMNGFDAHGYRLGYGGGFFDRTLAALRAQGSTRPIAIGVAYELARMPTIQPQPHDIAMDYVVTERGVYQYGAAGLVLLDAKATSAALSPTKYP